MHLQPSTNSRKKYEFVRGNAIELGGRGMRPVCSCLFPNSRGVTSFRAVCVSATCPRVRPSYRVPVHFHGWSSARTNYLRLVVLASLPRWGGVMDSTRIVLHIRPDDLAGAVDTPSHEIAGRSIVDASQGDARAGVSRRPIYTSARLPAPRRQTRSSRLWGMWQTPLRRCMSVSHTNRKKRWEGQAPMVHSAASAAPLFAEAAEWTIGACPTHLLFR